MEADVESGRYEHYRSFRIIGDAEMIPSVEEMLAAEGYAFEPEPFSPWCRRLLSEPKPIGASLAAFFGYIYIQDRSAMLPPLALDPAPGSAILDICASPGGKSSFLAQLTGPGGFVLANEPNRSRIATLRANLEQMNVMNAGTCAYEGQRLALHTGSWPYILLDPPCSGWGTINKNPKAAKIWQGTKINRLSSLQRTLLRHAYSLLRPGGMLLYSTCTTNYAENGEQTVFAENEMGLERVPLRPFPGFTYAQNPGEEGCLLVSGNESHAQGFYLSLMRKPGHPFLEENYRPEEKDLVYLPPCLLESEICDPSPLLAHGKFAVFNGKARFIHEKSHIIPGNFSWRGTLLGTYTEGSGFVPNPHARVLARKPQNNRNALVFDDINPLNALLTGQSLETGMKGKLASLWWRKLPLAFATLKNGRLVGAFGK